MRALLSVSNKRGLIDFARALHHRGCELVSTGGTARALGDAGLPVKSVSEVTGFPEMLDGRVKTLHPAVHGGILARRHRPDDLAALDRHGIAPIDLVAVNLYPFVEAAKNPATSAEAMIEEIDIGGPALIRAAAKNFRDVLVVVSPDDYEGVLAALDASGGPSREFRLRLARKAFAHTSAYDAAITGELSRVAVREDEFVRGAESPADLKVRLYQSREAEYQSVETGLQARRIPTLDLRFKRARDLRYGENPHQRASWFVPEGSPEVAEAILQGKELSFNNLLDLDAALRLVREFEETAAAIVKHTNPCGVAIGSDVRDAYVTARRSDPQSAFGGIVALNRAVNEDAARELVATFIEAVAAPAVEERARLVLAGKPNMRVVLSSTLSMSSTKTREEVRSVLGGVLVQEEDEVIEGRVAWPGSPESGPRVVTRRAPTGEEWAALRFAWRVCAHVKSNAVIFTGKDRTLAIGAGQMSRVDAVKVAIMKAAALGGKNILVGSVAASDAFFPFRDGLDALARAGATAVVQPGGSVRDKEVMAAADEHGLAMVFTGRRHFRH